MRDALAHGIQGANPPAAGDHSPAAVGSTLDIVPRYVYGAEVKRQELEATLRALGWYFLKHGGSHDLWAHPQRKRKLAVPRHKEIKEHLARSLLRQAEMPD